MNRLAHILVALFLSLVLVSCIEEPDTEFELAIGERIPNFTVQMNDGTTVTGAQLCNGTALIMFFHTGCPDCRNTLPAVQKIYDQLKDKISITLISREQPESEISQYWKEIGYTMPYSAQTTREIYNLFATSRVPRVYICNDGIIKHIYTDNPIPTYSDLSGNLELYVR